MFEKISNQELVSETKRAVAEERRVTARVLAHLEEVERRRAHLELGFSSLFEFCLRELAYSESEAFARISAMRLAREVPEAAQAVEDGKISLTNLAKAQSFFRKEKMAGRALPVEGKRELLKELEGLSTRECEKRLAAPEDAGMRLITFMADEALQADWQRVRELWGNQGLSDAELFRKMAGLVLARIDPDRKAVVEPSAGRKRGLGANAGVGANCPVGARQVMSDDRVAPPEFVTPAGRAIPARIKREVWKRDAGRCTFTHGEQRCTSRFALQFDHLDPYAFGGVHTAENLRLLCREHHRAREPLGAREAA